VLVKRRMSAGSGRVLVGSDGWIVRGLKLEALARFANDVPQLRGDLIAILKRHQDDARTAVAKRATKLFRSLGETLDS
jgi:hypothetical protein